ncbi:all-trans retinoic acid-induced differentiation factor [Prionailurus iriomotensis]
MVILEDEGLSWICIQCPGSVRNLSEVALYCKQTPELMLQARCCLNQKGTILGLDLQNCSLKDPGPNFPQAHTAVIIDLQANPLEDDLANIFRGFTQLQTLILPQDVSCPGGINAWNTVTFYMNNQTCQGQRNLCNSTGDQEMCPENGSCVPDGPGLLQCVCADGFHGYKCMRQLLLTAYVLRYSGIHHIIRLHSALGDPTPKSQGFMNCIGLPTDLKIILICLSPAREIFYLDRHGGQQILLKDEAAIWQEDGKLHSFGVLL